MRANKSGSGIAHAAARTTAGLMLMVALAHAAPALAFFNADLLQVLYGLAAVDANLEVLLRHRALLFGIVAAVLALGAFVSAYRALALAVGWVSVVSFLYLAVFTDGINAALNRVAMIDMGLAVCLAVATALYIAGPRHEPAAGARHARVPR